MEANHDTDALSLAVMTAVMYEQAQGKVQSDSELRECYEEDLDEFPQETTYTVEEFIAAVKKNRAKA